MDYIRSNKNKERCIFCTEMEREDGPDNLIVYRAKRAFVIINRYPYTSGHLMIVPHAHQSTLEDLDPQTRAEMMELISKCLVVLRKEYHPEGFNIGVNIGEAAGAGVLGHIHVHIVPRWNGDTNFMSAVAEARVIPESLTETFYRIQKAWNE